MLNATGPLVMTAKPKAHEKFRTTTCYFLDYKKVAVKSMVLFHSLQVSVVVQLPSKKFLHLPLLLLFVTLHGVMFGKNAHFVITALKAMVLCLLLSSSL
jgi:hypothetical protein